MSGADGGALILFTLIVLIPSAWFSFAQGAKRCHDVGLSGWYQLIPFFTIYLIFAEGKYGPNKYGDNPKGIGIGPNGEKVVIQSSTHHSGYTGGQYDGGHNGQQGSYSGGQYDGGHNKFSGSSSQRKSSGYNDGDLYK